MARPKDATPPPSEQPEMPGEDELIALEGAPDAAALKEMNVYQRMHRAAGMCRVIPKLGFNSFQRFKFVSHDQAALEARQVFHACGIVFLVNIDESSLEMKEGAPDDGGKAKVAFLAQLKATATVINVDKPDDRYSVTLPAYALDTSDKAMGKAISYAKKYALLALVGLMLATGDDPDNDNITVRGQDAGNQRRDNRPPARQDAPRDTQRNTRTNTRGNSAPPQGGQAPPPAGANQPPKVPADKAKAQEVIDRNAEANLEELDNARLLELSDAAAVMLGCPAGDYASAIVLAKVNDPSKAPRASTLRGAQRLTSLMAEWANLRSAVLAKNEGNEEAAKKALRDIKDKKGWGHIWELDPAAIQEVAGQFRDE